MARGFAGGGQQDVWALGRLVRWKVTSNTFQALSNQGVFFTADAEAVPANCSRARERGLDFKHKIMVLLAQAK